jgi:hypothetical protein
MWTMVLVTVVLAGSVTGGVATSTTFLDFADEAKCKTAAEAMNTSERIGINDRPGHPNISPRLIIAPWPDACSADGPSQAWQ